MDIRKATTKKSVGKELSGNEDNRSDIYNLEEYILKHSNADVIAKALIKYVSKNKNADAFSSAISMVNFYVNRTGIDLPDSQKQVLDRVKANLREYYKS